MVLAIINGHYDVAAMLVEKGANPNLADSSRHGRPLRCGRHEHAAVHARTTLPEAFRPSRRRGHGQGAADARRRRQSAAEDAAAAPAQQHEHAESRRGNDAADACRRVRRRDAHATCSKSTVPIRAVRQKNGTTMLMLAAGFGRRGDHNADAQEFERGTPEELLRAVKVCIEELGLDPNVGERPGRHGAARGAQRRHRAVSRRARRAARRQEQARADAAASGAGAYRPQRSAAAT